MNRDVVAPGLVCALGTSAFAVDAAIVLRFLFYFLLIVGFDALSPENSVRQGQIASSTYRSKGTIGWVRKPARTGLWRARLTVDSALRNLGLFVSWTDRTIAYRSVADNLTENSQLRTSSTQVAKQRDLPL